MKIINSIVNYRCMYCTLFSKSKSASENERETRTNGKPLYRPPALLSIPMVQRKNSTVDDAVTSWNAYAPVERDSCMRCWNTTVRV